MKKNVLNSAINQLGIEDGDVIKIHKECCDEIYQYENGAFTYLNSDNTELMTEDEIFDLITGKEFDIIAKGNKQIDVEEKLDSIKEEINALDLNVFNLNARQSRLEDKEEKKDKECKIAFWIDLGIFALVLLLLCLL